MQILQAILLGIVQGLTEFIPVSSSGHLILTHALVDGALDTLAFDLALHVGTLVALTLVFAKDFVGLAKGAIGRGPQVRMARLIILGTIPAVIAGVLLQDLAETVFRSSNLVAVNLIGVAFIMLVAERLYRGRKDLNAIGSGESLAVGLAQALALVPGVSRSGITITTGMLVGMDRVAATRFSFLLSAPIIAGASLKVLLDSTGLSQLTAQPGLYLAGATAAAISGYLAIKFLLSYLAKHSLNIFAYYRIIIGLAIILWL